MIVRKSSVYELVDGKDINIKESYIRTGQAYAEVYVDEGDILRLIGVESIDYKGKSDNIEVPGLPGLGFATGWY